MFRSASSTHAHDDVLSGLDRILQGRVCIFGIGNRARGDDGAGSLLAESLVGATTAIVIDGGAVPENYLGKVLQSAANTIVLIDAVDFGAAPGTYTLLDRHRIAHAGLSTHALSLGMAVEYLSRQSDAEVVVIGIQPARLDAGADVTTAVADGMSRLQGQLLETLNTEPEET